MKTRLKKSLDSGGLQAASDASDASAASKVERAARTVGTISNSFGFIVGDGTSKITVSSAPHSSPRIGDIWIDIG